MSPAVFSKKCTDPPHKNYSGWETHLKAMQRTSGPLISLFSAHISYKIQNRFQRCPDSGSNSLYSSNTSRKSVCMLLDCHDL